MSSEVLDAGGLDEAANSVDAVAMSLVLSYLAEPDDLLFEIYRVLKPGGRLVLSSLVRDAESSRLFLGIVARLETCPDEELPHWVHSKSDLDRGARRRQLIDATRRFADQGGELLRLEEEGLFKFYDGPELAQRVARRGFVDIRVEASFGTPPQAVIVTCRKP
jgi:ubiquinone/menaquinone biosynthesis C-methylase UbiE